MALSRLYRGCLDAAEMQRFDTTALQYGVVQIRKSSYSSEKSAIFNEGF
jgi:hypothetical protein